MRPNISMKMGNYYWGGPPSVQYYCYGVRIPHWLFAILYGRLCP